MTGSLRYGKGEATDATLPRKILGEVSWPFVPQPDTGRHPEYGKALERILVKELGKIAP